MDRRRSIVLGAGAAIHRRGRLLLVQRAEEPHRGFWAFPGGRVEVGETTAEAAVRETKEEVGLDVEIEGILDVVTYLPRELGAGHRDQVVSVDYLARPVGGKLRLNGESSGFRWILPAEVKTLDTTRQMRACVKKFAELAIR